MPNRLAGETSPYLLQHADNPVHWQPWDAQALDEARASGKPILLSIGYSACHWCHVMAHESFEDEATAAVMNRHFVNIKLDREERPDLDRIYQLAHQLMSQRGGGWPLTVVLDPETHAPFFAGTYFPREPRHGLPAFKSLLLHIAEWYEANRGQLAEQRARLQEAFRQVEHAGGGESVLDAAPLAAARRQLEENHDPEFGGFGDAPKFPQGTGLELLLDAWQRQGDTRARDIALHSLRRMALGGLFDQLGGGFCRYSVDAQWIIPHFEKMLYDNGPLLALCSDAAVLADDAVLARAAQRTADWVLREMQSPEGGYYASLDADSEGHEGRFYVWDRDAVQRLLGADDYPLFARAYGLDRPPNFEGQWHLHTFVETPALAEAFSLGADEIEARLEKARQRLFAAREPRVRPGRDDKILTSWNALMIRGMAVAARRLGRADCAASARRALDFIRKRLWVNGRLLATYKDGRAQLPAYLDDHAFLLLAILELLQLEWRSDDLAFARELADVLLARFEDPAQGGFFFTASDHEELLYRMKPLADESLPSGNGAAALGLLRLGWLLGETRYLDAAERCLRAAMPAIRRMPLAHAGLLLALRESLEPGEVLVLRGEPAALQAWQVELAKKPGTKLVFAIPADAPDLPEALAAKKPQGQAVAYVCRGLQCSEPVTELAGPD